MRFQPTELHWRGLNRLHGAPPWLHLEAIMWSLITLMPAQYQDGLLWGTWPPFCRVCLSRVRLCLRINVPPAWAVCSWTGPQAYATVYCYIWLHRHNGGTLGDKYFLRWHTVWNIWETTGIDEGQWLILKQLCCICQIQSSLLSTKTDQNWLIAHLLTERKN